MTADIKHLQKISAELKMDVMKMVYNAKDGHPGPAFSIAEIITALYFYFMNIDPKKPEWELRDRFLLSKGHSCLVLYAVLAKLGYFLYEYLLN